jgi:hypothetical protein
MKREQIQELFSQFENTCYDYKGIECWSARELQMIFNYAEWRNFLKVIEIRNKGRQAFLEKAPVNFSRVHHDYSDDKRGLLFGRILWKRD